MKSHTKKKGLQSIKTKKKKLHLCDFYMWYKNSSEVVVELAAETWL